MTELSTIKLPMFVHVHEYKANSESSFHIFKTSSLEFLVTSSDLIQKSACFFSKADDKIRIGLDYTERDWINKVGLEWTIKLA